MVVQCDREFCGSWPLYCHYRDRCMIAECECSQLVESWVMRCLMTVSRCVVVRLLVPSGYSHRVGTVGDWWNCNHANMVVVFSSFIECCLLCSKNLGLWVSHCLDWLLSLIVFWSPVFRWLSGSTIHEGPFLSRDAEIWCSSVAVQGNTTIVMKCVVGSFTC